MATLPFLAEKERSARRELATLAAVLCARAKGPAIPLSSLAHLSRWRGELVELPGCAWDKEKRSGPNRLAGAACHKGGTK